MQEVCILWDVIPPLTIKKILENNGRSFPLNKTPATFFCCFFYLFSSSLKKIKVGFLHPGFNHGTLNHIMIIQKASGSDSLRILLYKDEGRGGLGWWWWGRGGVVSADWKEEIRTVSNQNGTNQKGEKKESKVSEPKKK